MTVAIEPRLMTSEEFLALPDDDVERELIRGRVKEKPLTRRNRRHSKVEANVTTALGEWLKRQPEPRGEVLAGEAGFRLRRSPDTTVGIDVAYISPELSRANPPDAYLIDGPPVLAVEILSPSDTHEDISEKIAEYLNSGVQLVWVIDPVFRTVMVYQPRIEPKAFSVSQHLDGGAYLPGFRVAVAECFGA
jgi:Uma2 family endonuclease